MLGLALVDPAGVHKGGEHFADHLLGDVAGAMAVLAVQTLDVEFADDHGQGVVVEFIEVAPGRFEGFQQGGVDVAALAVQILPVLLGRPVVGGLVDVGGVVLEGAAVFQRGGNGGDQILGDVAADLLRVDIKGAVPIGDGGAAALAVRLFDGPAFGGEQVQNIAVEVFGFVLIHALAPYIAGVQTEIHVFIGGIVALFAVFLSALFGVGFQLVQAVADGGKGGCGGVAGGLPGDDGFQNGGMGGDGVTVGADGGRLRDGILDGGHGGFSFRCSDDGGNVNAYESA